MAPPFPEMSAASLVARQQLNGLKIRGFGEARIGPENPAKTP
jgi:hypothetical protein